ncbi:hypothetical protein CXG81DRAFT_11092, partial [Caulochytrium protostelioides]
MTRLTWLLFLDVSNKLQRNAVATGSLKHKQKQAHTATNSLQELPTQQQSLNLVLHLMESTVGAIAYLRMLFDDASFVDVTVSSGDTESDGTVPRASGTTDRLLDWIELGCHDALQKGYLRRMVFAIYEDPSKPDEAIECYTFKFSYPSEGECAIHLTTTSAVVGQRGHAALPTKHAILRSTTEMLRRLLVLTQTLPPLPERVHLAMKLFYDEDRTPRDYEPPLFAARTPKP